MNADQLWQTTLKDLQLQLTRATFETWLRGTAVVSNDNGALIIAAPSEPAKAWLDHRLRPLIERTLERLAEKPIAIRFVVAGLDDPAGPTARAQAETPPPAAPARSAAAAQPDSSPAPNPAQRLAQTDFAQLWNRLGWSPVAHYAAYFWQAYLGQAYALWKRLEAELRIPVKVRDIRQTDHRWSPPLRFYYRQLARMIGKRHPRIISGGEIECWQSMRARREGQPLAGCCGRAAFQPSRSGRDRAGQPKCLHWKMGHLERLYREHLVAIEEKKGSRKANHLRVQIWRLLPILTPSQVGQLNEALQAEHERWLEGRSGRPALGTVLGISRSEWEQIEAPSLVPLMSGYEAGRVLRGTYRPRAKFLQEAVWREAGEPF